MDHNERYDTRTAFIDMLLSGQMNLFVLVVLILVLIVPETNKNSGIETKAEYTVIIEWTKGLDCDVDLWVRGPNNDVVWFEQRDKAAMHLERDDTGTSTDMVTGPDGKVSSNPDNSEHWVLRATQAGTYVVNVHMFGCNRQDANFLKNGGSIPVRATLVRINPVFKEVFEKTVILATHNQEEHISRFSIAPNGDVTRVWEEPTTLVKRNPSVHFGVSP